GGQLLGLLGRQLLESGELEHPPADVAVGQVADALERLNDFSLTLILESVVEELLKPAVQVLPGLGGDASRGTQGDAAEKVHAWPPPGSMPINVRATWRTESGPPVGRILSVGTPCLKKLSLRSSASRQRWPLLSCNALQPAAERR